MGSKLGGIWRSLSVWQRVALGTVPVLSALWIWDYASERSLSKTKQRVSLLSAADLVGIDQIVIGKGQEAMEIQRRDGVWLIAGQPAFPADAKRIIEFLERLVRIKAAGVTGVTGLELGISETSTTLQLRGGGKDLLQIQLGKDRTGGGTWVEDKLRGLFLLDQTLTISAEVKEWEFKTLLNIPAAQVKSLAFSPPPARKGGQPFTVARPKEGEALSLTRPETKSLKLNASSISGLDRALENITFDHRYNAEKFDKTGLKPAGLAEIVMFDGRKVVARVASAGENSGKDKTSPGPQKYYLMIEGIDAANQGAASSGFRELNDKMSQWVFEVAAYQAMKFIKGLDDIVERPEKKINRKGVEGAKLN